METGEPIPPESGFARRVKNKEDSKYPNVKKGK